MMTSGTGKTNMPARKQPTRTVVIPGDANSEGVTPERIRWCWYETITE